MSDTRWIKRTMFDAETEASTEVLVPAGPNITLTVDELCRFLGEAGYVPEPL